MSTTAVNEEKIMDAEEIKKEIESNFMQFFGKDGKPMPVYQYKGHNILYLKLSSSALSKLHTVNIRPDDMLLYTYPGAGSHWLFEMTYMILNGNSKRVPIIKEDLLLDWSPVEHLESAESPRLLNTHLPIEFLPQELKKDHKMLFLIRNPKSMMVSYYKHLLGANSFEYNGDFPSYFELYMKGEVFCYHRIYTDQAVMELKDEQQDASNKALQVPYGDYFKHTQECYALIKDKPNVLIITYEEMKGDLSKTVSRVAKFLGKTISDQLTKSIVDMCSFDKMKSEKPVIGSYIPNDLMKDSGTFYHSGKVDTWKKWLTVEQSERIDAKIQSEFTDRGIKFNF